MNQQLVIRFPEALASRILHATDATSQLDVTADENESPNNFVVHLGHDAYPAALLNLPCPLETHKTFDKTVMYKAGDIGQVLCVYESEEARTAAFEEQVVLDSNIFNPSGLTAPTENIVRKKYFKTRKKSVPPYKVREVMEEIFASTSAKDYTETFEEVVDCEDWMLNPDTNEGITVTLSGKDWDPETSVFQKHPELLGKWSDEIPDNTTTTSNR